MKRDPGRLVGAIAGLWATLAGACATTAEATAVTPPPESFVGWTMDFEADRLDREGSLRLADLHGKVVLVDMFASWCVPCRDAIPAWGALRERLGADRIEVVGVAIDGERDMALDFVAEVTPSFPTVWDRTGDIQRRYPTENLPTLFMVDQTGIVRFVHVGFQDDAAAVVEARVLELLGRQSVQVNGAPTTRAPSAR